MINLSEIKMIPELMSYPGILRAAKEGTLVFFIGAGVSKIYNLPGWNQFAKSELEELFELGLIDYQIMDKLLQERDAKKILTITKMIRQKSTNQKGVATKSKDIFSVKSTKSKGLANQIYKNLFNLNAIYITTNYDDCIDVFWNDRNRINNGIKEVLEESNDIQIEDNQLPNLLEGNIFYRKEDIIKSKLNTCNIIHLHGSLEDEATMLVTIPDYLNFYGVKGSHDNPGIADFLDTLFNSAYTVVFLGYGLEEFELLEYMLQKVVDVDKKRQKHFMLYPTYQSEKKIIEYYFDYYKNFDIEIIPYDISNKGYKQLEDIIENWTVILKDYCKPKSNYVKTEELNKLIQEINADGSLYEHKVTVLVDYLKNNKNLEVHFFLNESIPKLLNNLEINGFFHYETTVRTIHEMQLIIDYWPQSKYLSKLITHKEINARTKAKVIEIYSDILTNMSLEKYVMFDSSIFRSLFEILNNLEANEIPIEILKQIVFCLELPIKVVSNTFRDTKNVLLKLIDEKNYAKVQEMIYITFLMLRVNPNFTPAIRDTYRNELLSSVSLYVDDEIIKRIVNFIEHFFEKTMVSNIVKNIEEELLVVVTRNDEGFHVQIREFTSSDYDTYYNKDFSKLKCKQEFVIESKNKESFVKQARINNSYSCIPWSEMYESFYVDSSYQDIREFMKKDNKPQVEALKLVNDLIFSLYEVGHDINSIIDKISILYESEYAILKKLALNLLIDCNNINPLIVRSFLNVSDIQTAIYSPYLNAEVKRLLNAIPRDMDESTVNRIIESISSYDLDKMAVEEQSVWRFKRFKELKHLKKVSDLLALSYSTMNPNYEMNPMIGEIRAFDYLEDKSPLNDEEFSKLSIDSVIRLLSDFKEEGGWENPSIEGLELCLSRDVKNNPSKYLSNMDKILTIKMNYFNRVMSTLLELDETQNMVASQILVENLSFFVGNYLRGEYGNEKLDGFRSICKRFCEYVNTGFNGKEFSQVTTEMIAKLIIVLLESNKSIESPMVELDGLARSINSLQGHVVKSAIMCIDYLASKDIYPEMTETILRFFYDYADQNVVEFYVWFGVYSSFIKNRFRKLYDRVFSNLKPNSNEWCNFMEGYLYNTKINTNVYHDMINHYLVGFTSDKISSESKRSIAEHLIIGYLNNLVPISINILLEDLFSKQEYNNISLLIDSVSGFFSRNIKGESMTIGELSQNFWDLIYSKYSVDTANNEGVNKVAANSLKLVKCIGVIDTLNLKKVSLFITHLNSEYIADDIYSWIYHMYELDNSQENIENISSILLSLSKVSDFTFDYNHPIKEFVESIIPYSNESAKENIRDIRLEFAKRDDGRLLEIKVD